MDRHRQDVNDVRLFLKHKQASCKHQGLKFGPKDINFFITFNNIREIDSSKQNFDRPKLQKIAKPCDLSW